MHRIIRRAVSGAGAGCIALAALGWIGPSLAGALASPWMAQAWGGLGSVALLLALMRSWRSAAMCAASFAALSFVVLPVLWPQERAATGHTVRIAYANLNAWNEPRHDAVQWFASADADVIAVIECSDAWLASLREASNGRAPLWPHVFARMGDHAIAGVAVLSRYPLRDPAAFVSPHARFPMADVAVDAPAGPLRILVAHPVPPISTAALEARNEEIRWLAERCAGSAMPTVAVADFNETPFGGALRDFAARSGMRSAARVSGLVTTWPASVGGLSWPGLLRIAIDHCFVSHDVGVAALSPGPDIGSDHLPMVIDVVHGDAGATRAAAPRQD